MSALWSAAGTVVPALTLTLALPEKHVGVVADSVQGLSARGRRRGSTEDDEAPSHRHDAYR